MDFFYLFKDINFQKGFLLIAMFILVLVILNVAYELSKTQGGQEEGWPPTSAPCPDYWDLSGAYCINSTGMNNGHVSSGKYSIWNAYVKKKFVGETCDDDPTNSATNPYYTDSPIVCTSGLRTIPIHTMTDGGNGHLNGGGIVKLSDGKRKYRKIEKKRQPMSRQYWANKYGFAWDGLKTKW